jgi:hypothetical protein
MNGVALGAKGHVLDRTEFFYASVRSDRSVEDLARFAIRVISDVLCKRGQGKEKYKNKVKDRLHNY